MVDINAAYREAKYLPDDALQQELSSPTGMIPGYIVMAELQDRQSIRGSAGGNTLNQPSMKDELLAGAIPSSGSSRQYSRGGIIAQLNPFHAMAQAIKNPELMGGYAQEVINQQSGGLPALTAAQAPGSPEDPWHLSDFQPTAPGVPQAPMGFSNGGLASLNRR